MTFLLGVLGQENVGSSLGLGRCWSRLFVDLKLDGLCLCLAEVNRMITVYSHLVCDGIRFVDVDDQSGKDHSE
jgi:hypothetical protein